MGETKTTTATARFAFFFWRVQVCGCHKRGVSTDLREIPLDYRGVFAGPGLASLRDVCSLGRWFLR